ncbi:MAG: hypothetical protein IPL99_29275 [Candidatus Competibacteraceae bacterium]|nr:hypothetical protein [Candidatus Competibacteraceae bacterium]
MIEIHPKRYRCPHGEGGPTMTQHCAWYEPNRPPYDSVRALGIRALVHSTVADVSRQLDVGVKAVEESWIIAWRLR